jgi:lipopolysaccharide/colanic/teichoic acid biosynthesis glycosyltransferase
MHRTILLLIDLCLIAFATVAALAFRENFEISPASLHNLLPYLGMTLALAAPVLTALGLNRGIWRLSAMSDYVRILVATLMTVTGAIALGFILNRLEGVARSLPVLQAVLIVCALVGARVLVRLRLVVRTPEPVATAPGRVPTHDTVLVVGLNSITELYLRSVAELAADRVEIAGVLARSERYTGRRVHQYPVLGTPEQIVGILRDLEVHGVRVDRIVVTSAFEKFSSQVQEALLELEQTSNIQLEFFAERIGLDARCGRAAASVSASAPSQGAGTVLKVVARRPYWRVKRLLDVVGALCLMIVSAPLMLLVAMFVAIDVGLPVTFWQQRPGAGGRPFKVYKFRTMAAAYDRHGRRIRDENRSSGIGRFLRRTRFDELPQLYNILVGEMSFIGPRPLLPEDQPDNDMTRLLVRPGLTGWAQVNGGRDLSIKDKTALDLWYVENASPWLDVKILLRTLIMIAMGERRDEDAIRTATFELGVTRQSRATHQGVLAPSINVRALRQPANPDRALLGVANHQHP